MVGDDGAAGDVDGCRAGGTAAVGEDGRCVAGTVVGGGGRVETEGWVELVMT